MVMSLWQIVINSSGHTCLQLPAWTFFSLKTFSGTGHSSVATVGWKCQGIKSPRATLFLGLECGIDVLIPQLSGLRAIARHALHVLPKGFTAIAHMMS